MGRGGGGALGFELPLGELQQHSQSQLVPLGEVAAGSFQHRALLFKVRDVCISGSGLWYTHEYIFGAVKP